MIHLLISLPNPSGKFLEELNKLFYNFIWQSKIEKIKRNTLNMRYEDGGLKMINIHNFMIALKTSWIKRLIFNESKWKYLFESVTTTKKFISFGNDYTNLLMGKTKNLFWKDVLYSWNKVHNKIKLSDKGNLELHNIWYNKDITVGGKTLFYNEYWKAGIRYINDILDKNGKLLNFESFKRVYKIKTNFLEYSSLRKAIKVFLFRNNTNNAVYKALQPFIPQNVKILATYKSVVKSIYGILCKCNNIPTSQSKWEGLGYDFSQEQWKVNYTISFKCCQETAVQWLQYRILHRILATNSLLQKLKKINSNLCTFCNNHCETIEHLFFQCSYTSKIWDCLQKVLHDKFKKIIPLDKRTIIFGTENANQENKIVNWLILNTKCFIYMNRVQKQKPNIKSLKSYIKTKLAAEKYILFKNCKQNDYYKYWILLENIFEIEPS